MLYISEIIRLICLLLKIGLEEDSCPFTSQSVHFRDHSQELFLLSCSVPQLTELTKSSKVMKIQESHDTQRYALNSTLFVIGKIQ